MALATRANAVAEDDAGSDHSPYTEAILEELKVPGLELGLFFRRVRDRVIQATNGRQEPFNFGSYGATPVYLNPQPANRPPVAGVARPLQVADNAGPTSLQVPSPTDPDQDQLVVQVIGLPQGGTVTVGNRALLMGDYLTVEQLKAAGFKPDGTRHGEAGSFDYSVSDGRGGSVKGAVAITVVASNRPPTVAAAPVFSVVANRLALPAVSDPDGDAVTLRIKTVPDRGRLRKGKVVLEPGDRLELSGSDPLTFDPEDAPPGPAGKLVFSVDDGRGGEASGSIDVEVAGPGAAPAAAASLDTALWRRLGAEPSQAELQAFLQLFPQSPHAVEARRRLAAAPASAAPAPVPIPAAPARAQAPAVASAPAPVPAAAPPAAIAAPEPAEEPAAPAAPAAPQVARAEPPVPGRAATAPASRTARTARSSCGSRPAASPWGATAATAASGRRAR